MDSFPGGNLLVITFLYFSVVPSFLPPFFLSSLPAFRNRPFEILPSFIVAFIHSSVQAKI